MKKFVSCAAALALILSTAALAQTYPVPQVQQIGSSDLFPDIVNGIPSPQGVFATAAQIGTYGQTLQGGNGENALIGGDFSTNLFQRGTSVAAITTTATYTADRWVAWSGAATSLTVSQQTGAADVTTGYNASLRVNKASGAGVVQSCIAQEVETANSLRLQGVPAEFDFYAKAGSTFSAANSNLLVSIVYGTGTDEGTSKLAFAFNGGGGGSSTWTGQTNAASNLAVPINTGWNRYTVAAAIPSTATEVAAIICYTPVGTGSSTDWFEFTGAQLVANQALAGVVGSSGAVLNANDVRAKSFARRPSQVETALQQRYTYSINEGTITAGTVIGGVGQAPTATTCAALVPFPVTMRAAPTYANALTASTFKLNSAAANVALSTPFSATTGVNTVSNGSVTFTASGLGATPGFGCELVSAAGSGQMLFSAEL